MLTQSVMIVVFVLREKITLGRISNGDEITLNGESNHKVPKRRAFLETKKVERGKPHKWETQILVGELLKENWI